MWWHGNGFPLYSQFLHLPHSVLSGTAGEWFWWLPFCLYKCLLCLSDHWIHCSVSYSLIPNTHRLLYLIGKQMASHFTKQWTVGYTLQWFAGCCTCSAAMHKFNPYYKQYTHPSLLFPYWPMEGLMIKWINNWKIMLIVHTRDQTVFVIDEPFQTLGYLCSLLWIVFIQTAHLDEWHIPVSAVTQVMVSKDWQHVVSTVLVLVFRFQTLGEDCCVGADCHKSEVCFPVDSSVFSLSLMAMTTLL